MAVVCLLIVVAYALFASDLIGRSDKTLLSVLLLIVAVKIERAGHRLSSK